MCFVSTNSRFCSVYWLLVYKQTSKLEALSIAHTSAKPSNHVVVSGYDTLSRKSKIAAIRPFWVVSI